MDLFRKPLNLVIITTDSLLFGYISIYYQVIPWVIGPESIPYCVLTPM